MKIIDGLVQNTPEWHAFRRLHLGASDAATIMGTNPWRSQRSLWEEKALGWEQDFDKKALARMKKGQQMEPLALADYQTRTGYSMQSMVGEHSLFPFLSASFDGMTKDLGKSVEIKCGLSSYKLAISLIIPEYYIAQLQHQMMISGHEKMDYYCFDGTDGLLIEIERDENYQKELLEKLSEFWHRVLTHEPPKD